MQKFPLLLAAASFATACDATNAATEPGVTLPDQGIVELDAGADATVVDTGYDAGTLVDSGCPAPRMLGVKDVPPGYLAPASVNFIRNTDGDTAHFAFSSGEVTVRYLYVDTEESFGAETTAFGTETKSVVGKWLVDAKDVVVALRESSKGSGKPDLDPYGRSLGLVFLDGELLQGRIVRLGYSAYYTQFGCAPAPLHDTLLHSEAEARANERGIWKKGHPTDYSKVLATWIGSNKCRPNPYLAPYCP